MKSRFRADCLNTLQNLPKQTALHRNKMINRALRFELFGKKIKTILLYWSIDSEPDLRDLLFWLRRRGVEVYLPFMEGESFKMVPFRYPMRKKRFNIYESGNTYRDINKIDLAIVPVVGVDNIMRRIGFGKGMYDRFFERLIDKPEIIFVQSKPCISTIPLCQNHDISTDLLITPYSSYKAARKSYAVRNSIRRRNSRC